MIKNQYFLRVFLLNFHFNQRNVKCTGDDDDGKLKIEVNNKNLINRKQQIEAIKVLIKFQRLLSALELLNKRAIKMRLISSKDKSFLFFIKR